MATGSRLGIELNGSVRVFAKKLAGTRAGTVLSRFLCGFFLARTEIFQGYSPLGVAYAASAAAEGMGGPAAFFGALLGYATRFYEPQGLKYIACLVLVCSAAYIFKDSGFGGKAWFMPLACAVSIFSINLVYTAGAGFPAADILFGVIELILMSGCAYFFALAYAPGGRTDDDSSASWQLRRSVGALTLTACILLSLQGFTILGIISPARIIAVELILLCARRAGFGAGAACGVGLGAVMDLGLGMPYYSLSYGLSGLLSGALSGMSKLACAAVYVLSGAIAALWAPGGDVRLSSMLEAFIASVVFMLINEGSIRRIDIVAGSKAEPNPDHARRLRLYAGLRLSRSATAFGELYRVLCDAFGQITPDEPDTGTVINRAAERVCVKCAMCSVCWERELSDTTSIMNEALESARCRGGLEADDFPRYFATRCLHFLRFVSAASEELSALQYRRQYRSRLRESRLQVCRQYAEFARVLKCISGELENDLRFDLDAEQRLASFVESLDLPARVSVFRDPNGRRRAEIAGSGSEALLEDKITFARAVSRTLGWTISLPELTSSGGENSVRFSEAEPYCAVVGIASHKKQGSEVSGDTGTYFKTDDGKLVVLLSDGMGTGRAAAQDSGMAVRLLERFLRAGIAPEAALDTLNSALVLRSEERESFVTVDLLIIDLMSGAARFYKYGAAPAYIRRHSRVTRVDCEGLPAGLGAESEPAVTAGSARLDDGELTLLVSDGVSDGSDDSWLRDLLAGLELSAPKDTAAEVVRTAIGRNGRRDDMTAVAVLLRRRAG